MVKNRGLTLTELIIAMVIGGIVLLAITCQFVAEQTFRTSINNRIAAINDASIAMHHMTRVLRYAKPSTVSTAPATGYVTSITATIDHAVAHTTAGDNLPEFTANTVVIYGWKADNSFEYTRGAATQTISKYITAFPVTSLWWDGANNNLTIQITAQTNAKQGNGSSSLNTKIRVLGG